MYFRYIYTKECCVKQVTFESLSLLYKDFYFSDVKHIIIGIWEFMSPKVNKKNIYTRVSDNEIKMVTEGFVDRKSSLSVDIESISNWCSLSG